MHSTVTLPSARSRLREATQRAHEDAEAAFSGFDLAQLPDYRAFLEHQASAVLPLEHELDAVGAESLLPDWPRRKRSASLLADLRDIDGISRPLSPPMILTPAAAWGMLYVLEGSRLGGRVLSTTVMRSGDARVRTATRFLCHGNNEQLWPSFVSALNAALKSKVEIEAAIEGALTTFAMFTPGGLRTAA